MLRTVLTFILLALIPVSALGKGEAFTLGTKGPTKIQVIASNNDETWEVLSKLLPAGLHRHPLREVVEAIHFLEEGLSRMTHREVEVTFGEDLAQGVVLVLWGQGPEALQKDEAIRRALAGNPDDPASAREAFYLRSEKERVLVVANEPAGLLNGVISLLESVDYEVLGMGPNWTHIPDYRGKPLSFSVEMGDRPGFYQRRLWATSGQERGVGTVLVAGFTFHPPDESVQTSYRRWRVGRRMASESITGFLGHALQRHHHAVMTKMQEERLEEGFLVARTVCSDEATPPTASAENEGWLWIGTNGIFFSDGKEWHPQERYVRAALDLSVPWVREIILGDLKQRAEAFFATDDDGMLFYGTDPEDGGGYAMMAQWMKYPNWFPQYLGAQGVAFGGPYQLHGFKGLDQPHELWDPASASDVVFGFNLWLLREYDRWIDSLPEAQRQSASGKSRKEQIRCSLLSYNYHDVPPNFNLDPRVRIMVASFPKNRGWGKWKAFRTQTDIGQAFQKMLPNEPFGNYRILSLAYFQDRQPTLRDGATSPHHILDTVRRDYDTGFRAYSCEIDFNFGKKGPTYYLYTKALWNPLMTPEEMEGVMSRWLRLAYGSASEIMAQYHSMLEAGNLVADGPNQWARAIRLLDAAGQKLKASREEQALVRINEVKQFWYFYYLVESGQATQGSPRLVEWVSKGQMSYMVAMHMVTRAIMGRSTQEILAEKFRSGPFHYSEEETAVWWDEVLAFWPWQELNDFSQATLANGKRGSAVDQNDLVQVTEFQTEKAMPNALLFNGSSSSGKLVFYTTAQEAGQEIGFKISWPLGDGGAHSRARDVSFGMSRWDAETGHWEMLIDITTQSQSSRKTQTPEGKPLELVEFRYPAPSPGTYRFETGRTGDSATLTTLDSHPENADFAGSSGGISFERTIWGRTQSMAYFYIPKGTTSLDLEVWDRHGKKTLYLFEGLPGERGTSQREIDLSERKAYQIPLQPYESGIIAGVNANGFSLPYLYSVPMIWAKSSHALLVPRDIVKADGLTPLSSPLKSH